MLLAELKARLPQTMREQLNQETLSRAYPLLNMLSGDTCIQELRTLLQKQYPAILPENTPINQALALAKQLQQGGCDHESPFKYRLPTYLGEYPVHSREINKHIQEFNQLIEKYHRKKEAALDQEALNKCYQNILLAITQRHMGSMAHSLWQLLFAMCAWSTIPMDQLLQSHSFLLSSTSKGDVTAKQASETSFSKTDFGIRIDNHVGKNKQTINPPFIPSFDYGIDAAGRIKPSTYLLLNGFAMKPGGHADALFKKTPKMLSWIQFQSMIKRQLSQLLSLSFDNDFFYWLQTSLQRLGVEFIELQSSSSQSYVSPFLNEKTTFNTLNEEMVYNILQEQNALIDTTFDSSHLSIISRYVVRLLQGFQYHRGQALGIGANWGGVVNDSNEAGADAFRFNDTEWAAQFKFLSLLRQGPAEARMNASKGVTYEFQALCSSFDYMTQLQSSEYKTTLYNAIVDNVMATLFPEPAYFENIAYTKYRRQYFTWQDEKGHQETRFFYQADTQGTYFKTPDGEYKQTPMFRQAGSTNVEAFPRDTGSGECSQSLFVANPLWPLQLQYAQATASSVRGHIVYNPTAPDTFLPDTFYGQTIRESDDTFIPFIGVVPKNFDKHLNEAELCASFVVRMMHSSRLLTHCPAFYAFYSALLSGFLPDVNSTLPPLSAYSNLTIESKWQVLQKNLMDTDRTASVCHKAFMSLFKELVYSLYVLTKEDTDLHFYFVELTTSLTTFEPIARATCERIIRELTTLKPLLTLENALERSEQYNEVLNTLTQLTEFFFPYPSDETAKLIAKQARIHSTWLVNLASIQDYFNQLKTSRQDNISPKVSPGLMHDAIKYQAPSPNVVKDYFNRRHNTNFDSGYRDLDGSQMVPPSTREKFLDIATKTVGGILPLFYRNKSFFSALTQPLSQAYLQGAEAYAADQLKPIQAILGGISGFVYGLGVGVTQAAGSIPLFFYTNFLAPAYKIHKPNHLLAISAAPANTPGLRVQAIMDTRDHLLNLVATANEYQTSKKQIIHLVIKHFRKIYPAFFSNDITTEENYKTLVTKTFPLSDNEWQQLSEPVIKGGDNTALDKILKHYQMQIDRLLIHALYECLTSPDLKHTPEKTISSVIEKHKLKDPRDNALKAIAEHYVENESDLIKDISQYEFNGSANAILKQKERLLRKVQTWMNQTLEKQWVLEKIFNIHMDIYREKLNENTLTEIVTHLPDCIKGPLYELLTNASNHAQTLKRYQLEPTEREFLLNCVHYFQRLPSEEKQTDILSRLHIESIDLSLSEKSREHIKFMQFTKREWLHQLPAADQTQTIVDDLKKQIAPELYSPLDCLHQYYLQGVNNIENPTAFDIFYLKALEFQAHSFILSPINEWVNVTMSIFLNRMLDKCSWHDKNESMNNLLLDSVAMVNWLRSQKLDIRSLLSQQIEQSKSFDHAAWRCQMILHVIEKSQSEPKPLSKTGMQKLLRFISQNTNRMTTTKKEEAKEVSIATLCKNSITMQYALKRVKKKVPEDHFVRAIAPRAR